MNNKKILISFLLVVLIALSVGSVSAEDATDVIAVDDAADIVAADEPITPASDSVEDVQTAIDTATSGQTVDLSKYTTYNFTNNTVTIKTDGIIVDGKGNTTIYGYGDGDGIIAIKAKNVTLQGIKFVDTNPNNDFKYNGTVSGWGVSASQANGGLVKDCEFTDFNSGIVVMQTTGFDIENNKFNGGYTTKLLNDPTVNKETGSKSLNIYRQSSQVTVKNNTFEGPILDGVSIAQGSGSNYVIGNTFIGNCYSIYFGGASTVGSVIANNTFINCGYFKEGDIFWEELPVISMQKASDGVSVEGNTFQAISNNILIAAEKDNEAHGYPSEIGDINVTGNTVVAYNGSDLSTVTLFNILVRNGTAFGLDVSSPIIVANNTLNGAKGIRICYDDVEIYSANSAVLNSVLYPDTIFTTAITAPSVSAKVGDKTTLLVTLKDSDGNPLYGRSIAFIIDGKEVTASTDVDGIAALEYTFTAAGTKYATAIFAGESNVYKSSYAPLKVTVTKKATALTAAKATLKVKKAKKVTVTLKSSGKAVASKKITISVNGKTFSAKTNKNGKATISVKVAKKGSFTATVKFAGDSTYKAVTKKVKYTVKK